MNSRESRIMVDSSVWMEIVKGTEKGEKARDFLVPRAIVTTTISIAEVERALIRDGEDKKIDSIEPVMESSCIDIDKEVAKRAARMSLEKNLRLADALIASASELNDCILYTGDRDFVGKGLNVMLLK